ncbi:MAG: helix-turn-helix transcriptional regulator [Lachnospiraceae bacterium]|nr:helix-turn-helix transcriptional regulator [Lachnospiraceae bacterium]
MVVSYNKLWKLMIDKGMNKSDLRTLTGIGTNTLAKLSKNQMVSMEVMMRLCEKLDCDISDVCEFVKEQECL